MGIQPGTKPLEALGQPKRAAGVRATSWQEQHRGTSVCVTATTCEACSGTGYAKTNAQQLPVRMTVKFGNGAAVRVPECVPCKGLGFVIARQRELAV